MSNANGDRQKNWIRKLEKELIEGKGFSPVSLDNIRRRIIDDEGKGNTTFFVEERNESDLEAVPDRTPEAYQVHLNEIKLLRKV